MKANYHTHTWRCNHAAGTEREYIERAIESGIEILGFSEHSYLPFEEETMKPHEEGEYRRRVLALKDAYRGRMKILCGVEKDIYSPIDESVYDYTIGSVHYIRCDNAYASVDLSPEATAENVLSFFCGDPYAYAKAYFELVAGLFDHVRADIIGHMDLLTKFHEKQSLLDTEDRRYEMAWKEAVAALIPHEKPFEINSGAISRGWRSTPYHSADILKFIRQNGGRILLTSDSHARDTLRYRFDESRELALACGFTTQWIPTGDGGLTEVSLL